MIRCTHQGLSYEMKLFKAQFFCTKNADILGEPSRRVRWAKTGLTLPENVFVNKVDVLGSEQFRTASIVNHYASSMIFLIEP